VAGQDARSTHALAAAEDRTTSGLAAGGGCLSGVAVVSARDIWAAGFVPGRDKVTLIEHWNGTAWKQVT
jgi:hypothetical protein